MNSHSPTIEPSNVFNQSLTGRSARETALALSELDRTSAKKHETSTTKTPWQSPRPWAVSLTLGAMAAGSLAWSVWGRVSGSAAGASMKGMPYRLREELSVQTWIAPWFFAGAMLVLALLAALLARQSRAATGRASQAWIILADSFLVLSFVEYPMLQRSLGNWLPSTLMASGGPLLACGLLIVGRHAWTALSWHDPIAVGAAAVIYLFACAGSLGMSASLPWWGAIDSAAKATSLILLVWALLEALKYRPMDWHATARAA